MVRSVMHAQRGLIERDRQFTVRALIASAVGTTIDFYDFTLYNVVAAIYIGKLFFPGHDPFLVTLAGFATTIPGFVARPVGGALFGHWGDRLGRKATLIATLAMMGFASIGIGLVPTYAQIGVWGAVLLVLLRVIQGLGVSGEWGGAVLLGVEWQQTTRGHRGLAGGWAMLGLPAGFLLAYVALMASTAVFGQQSYWGWRVPFLCGSILVFVGLYVRLGVLETPAFTRVLEQRRQFRWPLLSVLRYSWRPLILCFLASAGPTLMSPLVTSYVLSYATKSLHVPQPTILAFVMVGSAVSIFSMLFWSRLSDAIGRRRMYIIGGLTAMAFAIPYWLLLDSRVSVLMLFGVVISMVVRDMQYGPLPSTMAEAFPTGVRYTGATMGYNLGSAFFSGTTAIIAVTLLHTFHTATAIGLFMMGGAALSVIGALLLRDRSRESLDDEAYEEAEVRPLAVSAG
jgi:MFS family permease